MPQIPVPKPHKRCRCGGYDLLFYLGIDITYVYCEKCMHSASAVKFNYDTTDAKRLAFQNWQNEN